MSYVGVSLNKMFHIFEGSWWLPHRCSMVKISIHGTPMLLELQCLLQEVTQLPQSMPQ